MMTRWFAGFSMLLALLVPFPVAAQGDYPTRPIEILVAFPPGGPVDTATRIVQPKLSAALGVPVVLVTKAGAGGAVAMDTVARARPDGYTLTSNIKSTLTIIPAVQADVAYKLADFAPVGTFAVDSQAILVKAGGPLRTLEEVVDHARKNPGKLTYGSAGTGTLSFFNMELLKAAYGLDITHVPFQGTGPVKSAILGGHVSLASSALSPLLPLVKSGDLVAIVTTAPRRIPALGATPTMVEKGFPEASLSTTMQLFAPARTPRDVVEKLAKALQRTMQDPSVVAAVESAGMFVEYRDPEATRSAIESEHETVARLVKKIGLGK
jgi:tripartite-type tricarboxylate transporter receptor subunit TctC